MVITLECLRPDERFNAQLSIIGRVAITPASPIWLISVARNVIRAVAVETITHVSIAAIHPRLALNYAVDDQCPDEGFSGKPHAVCAAIAVPVLSMTAMAIEIDSIVAADETIALIDLNNVRIDD